VWLHLGGDGRAGIADGGYTYYGGFGGAFAVVLGLGLFRSTDPALAAAFLLTALNGIASWYRTDGRLSPDRIADHYVELALGALMETAR
jgi:hypothetical protein